MATNTAIITTTSNDSLNHNTDETIYINNIYFYGIIFVYYIYLIIKNIYIKDFNTLKDRLFKRGDTQQVLDNAEKINLAFRLLAEEFSELYDNVFALDISKEDDQIKFFESCKNYMINK